MSDPVALFERFDFDTYGRLLALLESDRRAVRFCDLRDEPWPERFFILRHDVDLTPESALRMAEFERARGTRATYFLLLSGRFYNLQAPEYSRLPARLVELGHEVGLHYNVDALVAPGGMERALRAQADLLSLLAGTEVHAIAMHNPSSSGADPFRQSARFLNAYGDRFAREIDYISDSCGAWRDQAVTALSGATGPARLQLLIHPFFWGERHADRWQRLNEFVEQRRTAIAARAAATREAWSAHAGVREHDARRP